MLNNKFIFRFNAILVMIPDAFLHMLILKFIWKFKKPRVAKQSGKQKNKVEGFTHPTQNLLQSSCNQDTDQ